MWKEGPRSKMLLGQTSLGASGGHCCSWHHWLLHLASQSLVGTCTFHSACGVKTRWAAPQAAMAPPASAWGPRLFAFWVAGLPHCWLHHGQHYPTSSGQLLHPLPLPFLWSPSSRHGVSCTTGGGTCQQPLQGQTCPGSTSGCSDSQGFCFPPPRCFASCFWQGQALCNPRRWVTISVEATKSQGERDWPQLSVRSLEGCWNQPVNLCVVTTLSQHCLLMRRKHIFTFFGYFTPSPVFFSCFRIFCTLGQWPKHAETSV